MHFLKSTRRAITSLLLPLVLTACGGPSSAVAPRPTPSGDFTTTVVFDPWLLKVDSAGKTFNFYLHVPEAYDRSAGGYPLLLVLHGDNGRRGFVQDLYPDDLSFGPLAPLYTLGALYAGARSNLNAHIRDSFVVYPKIPQIDDTFTSRLGYWNPDALDNVIEYVATRYHVDRDRLYVTGLSMGGWGTFHYARSRPGGPAAIVPICNGLYPTTGVENLRGLPVWLFHNFDDPRVPYASMINPTVEALMTGVADVMEGYPFGSGGQAADDDYTVSWAPQNGREPWTRGVVSPTGLVTYTLYRSGGHDAWTKTYANDAVWEWLYAQRRK